MSIPLSARLKSLDSGEGRKRLAEHLESLPFPHYEPASDLPGLLVRIEQTANAYLSGL